MSRVLLPVGAALLALGRVAWQAVFVLAGDSLAGSVRAFAAALGLALVAWAARRPETRTGPMAAGAAITIAADAWVVAANVESLGRWMLPFSVTMLALLVLAWTSFTTANGAWGRGSARGAAVASAVGVAGALAWVPLNLEAGSVAFLPGTSLTLAGFATLFLALLPESGVPLPKLTMRRARSA